MSSRRKSQRRSTGEAFLFSTGPEGCEVDEDVFGMDASAALGFLTEQRRRQNVAAAQELRGITHWADLHRVTDGTIGSVDKELYDVLPTEATLLGLEAQLRLAGQGTFMVTEFGVCEAAAALGISEPAARALVGQALELRDRLPRLWGRVMNGELVAWKARRIAEETIPLNPSAAAYVDAHLAAHAAKLSIRRILGCVHAAIGLHDPALAKQRAKEATDGRGVWFTDTLHGTTHIAAVTSTPEAHALDATLNHTAADLAALGDEDPEQVRRAKALGILADPQGALDLATAVVEQTAQRPSRHHPGPTIHLHVHTDSLADAAVHGVVRVEGGGIDHNPYPVAAVETWLTDLAPGATIKVTPVVDLNQHHSVDAYEIPERLRDQITERDHGCVFPWCGRRGRFDIDHTDPYTHDDDRRRSEPPPGQTNTANLARLCRFHHRVKTRADRNGRRWRYHRLNHLTVEWTSPHGRVYRVDNTGTAPAA